MSFGIPVSSLRAEIGVDGEEVAAAKLAHFGTTVDETATKSSAGFGRIGVAARAADTQLARFGVPFAGTAGTVLTSMEGIERGSTSLGGSLSNLGRAEATAAVVGLAAVATEGVHLADDLELSHARLQVAVQNAGQSWDTYSGQIDTTDKQMEKLGFTNADTEASLARLENTTHDVTKAQNDERIAADVSAGTHKNLTTATTLLVQAEAGRYTQLSRLGIATKAQIAGFKDSQDAVNFLAATFRGDAAAATDTFAGKMKVLSATGEDLGAQLGIAVIPKVEQVASGAVAGVHAFQDFNTATHGLSGKVLELGAAVPLAFFAMDKLQAAGALLGGSFSRLGEVLGITTAETEAAAVADGELATAATTTAAAEGGLAATLGTVGAALVPLGFAYLGVKAANDALTPSLQSSTAAVDKLGKAFDVLGTGGNSAFLIQQYGAGFRGLAADVQTASKADSGFLANEGAIGGFFVHIVQSITGARDGFQIATQAVNDTSKALTNLSKTDPQAAIASFENLKANLIANGATAKQVDKVYKDLEGTLHLLPGPTDAATQAQTNLTTAQGRFASDITSHKSGAVLAADYDKVRVASGVVATAQQQVEAATNAGSAAITGGANAATAGAFAYLGLASSVKTAAAAYAGLVSNATTNAGSPYQLQLDTSAAQASADALHGKLDSAASAGGSGGGGGGQTATAAALDQKQKELALRDAMRQVTSAETGVTQAQHGLTSARQQAVESNQALSAAETNYKTILNGVAASSKVALAAQQALTQARRDAESQTLAVEDAERNLALAKSDSRLNGFGVTDAQSTLTASQAAAATGNQAVTDTEAQLAAVRANSASTATDIANAQAAVNAALTAAAPLNEQVTKDEVALDDARINATGDTETITKAELDLSNQRAAAKQKTQDLSTAQQLLTDTLKGYPPHSKEAQQATNDLRDAQIAAKSAADGVVTATQAIVTAQDQIPTSVLGVERAQADLDGKLTAAAGSGGGMGKLETTAGNLITRLEDLRQKTIAVANDMGTAAEAAGVRAGEGIQAATADGLLANIGAMQAAVAAEPLLAHAFDSVIAQYRGYVNAIDDKIIKSANVKQFQHPVEGHAAGGFAAPGSTFTVGESGFEVAHARIGGGVDILSNPQSRHALTTPSGSNSDGALISEVRKLNATLAGLQPLHIDNVGGTVEQLIAELDKRDRRERALANLTS